MVEGIDTTILAKIIFEANWRYVEFIILFFSTFVHGFKNSHNENILESAEIDQTKPCSRTTVGVL